MSVLRVCTLWLVVCLTRISGAEVNLPALDDPTGRIDRVEYFFGDDPGRGNGTQLRFDEGADGIIDLQFRPDLSGLDYGVHTLVIRARNRRSEWSLLKTHAFHYVPYGVGQPVELARTEYFLDEDPGLGQAQPFDVVPGESRQIEIDLNQIASGPNRRVVGIRAQDSLGNWGLLRRFEFVKVPEIRASAVDWAILEGENRIAGGRQALAPTSNSVSASIDSGLLATGGRQREITATVRLVLAEKIVTEPVSDGFSIEWLVDPLLFLTQPQSIAVVEGDPINLRAEVGGTAPFAYQWQKNGRPIPGATGNQVMIAEASTADAGLYSVTVVDAFGELSSEVARVDVEAAPVVVTGQVHPADRDEDWELSISEVTAYGAAWKRGEAWPVEPSEIPISYVTRAGSLWKTGEAYEFDSAIASAPLWWVSRSAGLQRNSVNRGVATAERREGEGVKEITIQPNPSVRAYAYEEVFEKAVDLLEVPAEATLSEDGRRLRWGPFMDGLAREFRYRIDEAAFEGANNSRFGILSYDGFVQTVPAEDSTDEAAVADPVIAFDARLGGLRISSIFSQKVEIQAKDALESPEWRTVETLIADQDSLVWLDPSFEANSIRFYRVQVTDVNPHDQ